MPDSDIQALLDRIADTFSRLDMAAWFQCFHQPHVIMTDKGGFSPIDITQCENLMGSVFEKLREQGFVKSTLDDHKVSMLTDTTAVVSAIWSRWDKDGKLIQTFGATYFLNRVNGQWGISLLATHKAENNLLINEGTRHKI